MANTHSASFTRASSQYARRASDLGITGGSCTIETWIYLSSTPADGTRYGIAFVDDLGTHTSNELWYDQIGGVIKLHANRTKGGVADNTASYTVTLSTATWYHVVYRYDGTDVKLYTATVGGTHTERATVGATGNGTVDYFDSSGIGTLWNYTADASTIHYFDGLIDDVRVWNTARTTTQMDANFETELVGNETGLVAYYKLNNTWDDTTSNAFNLTATNSPTFSATVPPWPVAFIAKSNPLKRQAANRASTY